MRVRLDGRRTAGRGGSVSLRALLLARGLPNEAREARDSEGEENVTGSEARQLVAKKCLTRFGESVNFPEPCKRQSD